MVEPQQKRSAVEVIMSHGISERKACSLVKINRNTHRYKVRLNEENGLIRELLKNLAVRQGSASYGLPRLQVEVRKQFCLVNHKRVERIYREANLQLARRPRKHVSYRSTPLEQASSPGQRWSMDFMMDNLANSRKFRVFNLIDTFSKELVHQVVDSSIQGTRLVREFETIAEQRSLPKQIICDNGPEFRSKAMLKWSELYQVELCFIQPGKPTQNAFVESLNGKMRKECLDRHIFSNLLEARRVIGDWRRHYNEERPHSALNYLTPREFIEGFEKNVVSKSVHL
jgi:putative transposase